MTLRVRGILFDLGETLLDFGAVDFQRMFLKGTKLAYERVQQFGQPVPSFAAYHRRQLWAVKWHHFKGHITGREFSALDLIARSARKFGQDLTDAQLRELAWLWYRPLREQATVEPGLGEMLDRLRGDGLTLGVVSNTFVPAEALDRHLAEEGLLDCLPVRSYSCDVGYRKPHAAIFDDALRRTGLSAEETLFVGDRLRADVDGANRMGMTSVLKDPTGRHRGSRIRPHHRIRSILEVPAVVAEHNHGP